MHEQKRYPHLLDQDAPVLTAFLLQHGHDYRQVDFDVRIGTGRDPGPDYDEYIRKMALDLSRRRIDALGTGPRGTDIIEVTSDAGMTALGQLIAYRTLWIREHPDLDRPRIVLAARSLQTDVLQAYKEMGVVMHLYPDA